MEGPSLFFASSFSLSLQAKSIQNLGAIAYSLYSFGEESFDISVIKGGQQCLHIITVDGNANSTSMDFWSAIAYFKNVFELLLPQTHLLSIF